MRDKNNKTNMHGYSGYQSREFTCAVTEFRLSNIVCLQDLKGLYQSRQLVCIRNFIKTLTQ